MDFIVYLWRHYDVYAGTAPAYAYNGADQLLLFGPRYQIPEYALLAFAVIAVAVDIFRRHRENDLWKYYALPIQLYVLVELSVWLLPGGIHFPPPTAALALLTERLTSVSAALICCLLGAIEPRRWHLATPRLRSRSCFSAFLYPGYRQGQSHGSGRWYELVSQLPPNQRVMATIEKPEDSRVPDPAHRGPRLYHALF